MRGTRRAARAVFGVTLALAGTIPGAVAAAPSLEKSFVDDPAAPGGTVTLEFTILNQDPRDPALELSFTDDLDAALPGLVATGLPLINPCGLGSQLVGTSLLTLVGGSLLAGAACTFQVTLQVPLAGPGGVFTNTTGILTATMGGEPVFGNRASDSLTVLAPDNDLFAARIDLGSADRVQTTGTNVGFTGEFGEPEQSGEINSAWWQWTAGRNGTLIVDTFGSDFDTYLTVATGVVVSNLTVLAQNDDARGTLQSEIVLDAVAGTPYQIAVDGFGTATGTIALNLVPEPSSALLQLGGLGALLALGRFAARGISRGRSAPRR